MQAMLQQLEAPTLLRYIGMLAWDSVTQGDAKCGFGMLGTNMAREGKCIVLCDLVCELL